MAEEKRAGSVPSIVENRYIERKLNITYYHYRCEGNKALRTMYDAAAIQWPTSRLAGSSVDHKPERVSQLKAQ